MTIRRVKITPQASVSYAVKSEHVTIVALLGVGQNGRNVDSISAATPDYVALIEAMPYHKIPLPSLEPLCLDALKRILNKLSPERSVHLVAESQAAPLAVLLAAKHPERFRSITLLAPLGFNKPSLGSSAEERYRTLMNRSRAFWSHPNQSLRIKANRDTLLAITRRSLPAVRRLRKDYTNGAEQDVVEYAKQLASRMPVHIIADKNDGLFPYDEIQQTIKGSAIILEPANIGSHINRASPKGLAQFKQIISRLGSDR